MEVWCGPAVLMGRDPVDTRAVCAACRVRVRWCGVCGADVTWQWHVVGWRGSTWPRHGQCRADALELEICFTWPVLRKTVYKRDRWSPRGLSRYSAMSCCTPGRMECPPMLQELRLWAVTACGLAAQGSRLPLWRRWKQRAPSVRVCLHALASNARILAACREARA